MDVDAIKVADEAVPPPPPHPPLQCQDTSGMFYGNIPLTMDAESDDAENRPNEASSSSPPSVGDTLDGAEVLSTRRNAYTVDTGSLPTPYLTKMPQKQSVITGAMMSKNKGKSSRYALLNEMSRDTQLVIIRHGKTEYNKLGLFTGWDDAPLAQEGCEEAVNAGKLLKMHGFTFDVVYTSWLSRAIETAWLVLDELDCLWLPIVKSWRLNERMYGSLTGLSKKMVKERHGACLQVRFPRVFVACFYLLLTCVVCSVTPTGIILRCSKFMAWRWARHAPAKSVVVLPVLSRNDERYVMYLTDVRWSVTEAPAHIRRAPVFRKLPKLRVLSCMDLSIPYFRDNIVPNSINQGSVS